jgi:hypothetical protein
MSAKLAVDFSAPKHGWIPLSFRRGEDELLLDVSHTPFDGLEELAGAAAAFLEARRHGIARLNAEPDEYDVMFEAGTDPGSLRVTALHSPRRRRASGAVVVWVHEGAPIQIGRTLWRAFRKLESRFDSAQWAHRFPPGIVERLDQLTAQERG